MVNTRKNKNIRLIRDMVIIVGLFYVFLFVFKAKLFLSSSQLYVPKQ